VALGIRMDRALGDGAEIGISDVDPSAVPLDLKCLGCGAKVSFVRDHVRNVRGIAHAVHRFFRVSTSAGHAAGCRFSVDTLVDAIVAQSEPLDGAEALLVALSQGVFELRLHVLVDPIKEKSGPDLGSEPEARPVGRRFVPSNRALPPYLRSALAVARIYLLLERPARAELRKHIVLNFRGKTIRWADFCYSIEDYPRLAKRLLRSSPGYPIATEIHVKDWNGQKGYLQGYAYSDGGGDKRRVVVPRLIERTDGAIPAGAKEVGSAVLAVGRAYCRENDVFANVYVDIHHTAQAAVMNEARFEDEP
jgi:hypothetical protein